jgi:hypothetical protein
MGGLGVRKKKLSAKRNKEIQTMRNKYKYIFDMREGVFLLRVKVISFSPYSNGRMYYADMSGDPPSSAEIEEAHIFFTISKTITAPSESGDAHGEIPIPDTLYDFLFSNEVWYEKACSICQSLYDKNKFQ